MQRAKKTSESITVMTEMIMPNDTNPLGNLMGGNLLRWMDVIGGICAGRHCESHVVTASVDHVSFTKSILNGDVITLTAKVTRAFTTSVEVYVEVTAADIKGHNPRRSNHAYFTFVAIDEKKLKPVPVPAVVPLTADEEKMYEAAPRRRELRMILSGRMKPEDAELMKEYFQAM
ncbi:MAG: acyl-CoA thioesterase [Saprospiraceae bacterium]